MQILEKHSGKKFGLWQFLFRLFRWKNLVTKDKSYKLRDEEKVLESIEKGESDMFDYPGNLSEALQEK